jgi:hypothetical protein
LQHHAVLRTVLTIRPHTAAEREGSFPSCRLLVDLIQGSYFTLMPYRSDDTPLSVPRWHSGNIYAMERSLPQSVTLPHPPSPHEPTKYYIYVAGDYEIRLFGDPLIQNADGNPTPVQKLQISVALESPELQVQRIENHDIVPDFVSGFAFGSAFGVGLKSVEGWWTVMDVKSSVPELDFSTPTTSFRIAPTQARILPLNLKQHDRTTASEVTLVITLRSSVGTISAHHATLNLIHHKDLSTTSMVKVSYLFANAIPTMFYALPPTEPFSSEAKSTPPLLALHGAGVDIFTMSLWQEALPRQKRSWVVVPSSLTSWVQLLLI